MMQARRYSRERPRRDYKYGTTLAIDWGSEAIRAKLFRTAEDGQIVIDKLVQYASTIEDMTSGHQELKRQFTSQIYPFDHTSPNPPGEMVYPGNKRIMERRSISSKLAMYGVLEIPAELAEQSLELQQSCDLIQRNPHLKQIIRIGIEQMLFCVLRRVYEELTCYPDLFLRILDAIALTVPAQWPIEFEEEYGQRLMAAWQRVFGYPLPQVIFLSEGQTNAHYAFSFAAHSDRQYLPEHQQDIFSIGSTTNAVLIIDAGGHSTNTSLVTICEDGNQLEIRPDYGALGGTAMWGLRILNQAKKSREEKFPEKPPMPVEAENQILKSFYLWSPELRDDSGACLNVRNAGPNRETFNYDLQPQELVQIFEEANAHAFALIEAGIVELKALQPRCEKIKVMIGGGSAHGPMWVARMKRLVAKHQMEEPIFLQQIDALYEHARLAGGANFALANAKSVAQFVDKAAFGLAVKKRFMGNSGWTRGWHYEATMLWAQGRNWVRNIKTEGSQEFKIICQPEYDDPQAGPIIRINYRAYDILPVPCRKTGILQFDLEINTDTDKLKLTIKHKKSGRGGRFTEVGQVEFDLWVPPGSRTLQIWSCNEDIKAAVAAAFSPNQQPAGSDGSDGNGGGLPDAPPLLQAQHEAPPQPPAEDVEMGGMEDAGGVADSITVASASYEAAQPAHEDEGSQAAARPGRRGSRVPTGMFAL